MFAFCAHLSLAFQVYNQEKTDEWVMQDGAELLVTLLDVEAAEQEAAQKNAALAAEHELRLSQQTKVPLQPLCRTVP